MEENNSLQRSLFARVSQKAIYTFFGFLGVISFMITLVIITKNVPNEYSNIYLLPFVSSIVFFVCSIFTKTNNTKERGGALLASLILFMYFIRNVLSTFSFVNSDYESVFRNYTKTDFNQAIALMSYEFIVVSIVVLVLVKKNRYLTNIPQKRSIMNASDKSKLYFFAVVLNFIICVVCLILSNELRSTYYSIFISNFADANITTIDSKSTGIYRIVYTGGKMLINSFRFIFPVTIITLLSRKTSLLRLHLCFLIACLQILFMTDGNAYILILTIVQIMYIIKLYPQYSKLVCIYLICIFAVVIILVIINRFSHTYYANSSSSLVQSYFSGISNYAAGVHMIKNNTMPKFPFLFEDVYSCVPFRNTIFGYEGTGYRLADYYNEVSHTRAQIIPAGVESAFYFSFLFSPIASVVMTVISFKSLHVLINNMNEKSGIEYAVNLLIAVVFALSPVMYDSRIVLQLFLQFFIIMIVFSSLSKSVKCLRV